MAETKTVNLAGVVVTNGTAKFHTSGPQKSDAQFYKLPVPLAAKHSEIMAGSFAFILLPKAMTKADAAAHLKGLPEFKGNHYQNCLQAVIDKNTPQVRVPKAEKAVKKVESKAKAKEAFKGATAPTVKTPEQSAANMAAMKEIKDRQLIAAKKT